MKLNKNKLQIFITLVFIGFVGWWISFQSGLKAQGLSVQWFEGVYGLIALFGSIIGFVTARRWGGHKTVLGKALLFFSFGLLAQEAGQLILNYYIYVSKIQIPYPSLGDIAYSVSTLSYLCGGLFLAKAVGIKYSLKSTKYRALAGIVPLVLFIASFVIFLHHYVYDFHHPLTVFLNLFYPLGDATYIAMGIVAFLLSRKMLGGIMRAGILILILALILQYSADFSFLYASSRASYLAGNHVDLLYLISYFVTTTALIRFFYTHSRLSTVGDSSAANPPAVTENN
jgi:hypothetical protein